MLQPLDLWLRVNSRGELSSARTSSTVRITPLGGLVIEFVLDTDCVTPGCSHDEDIQKRDVRAGSVRHMVGQYLGRWMVEAKGNLHAM
jgi:hypothetical protein